jgi:hypothetical protein
MSQCASWWTRKYLLLLFLKPPQNMSSYTLCDSPLNSYSLMRCPNLRSRFHGSTQPIRRGVTQNGPIPVNVTMLIKRQLQSLLDATSRAYSYKRRVLTVPTSTNNRANVLNYLSLLPWRTQKKDPLTFVAGIWYLIPYILRWYCGMLWEKSWFILTNKQINMI